MIPRRSALKSIGATIAVGAGAAIHARSDGREGAAERIAILGTGNLGRALAQGWSRTGHPVVYGSRTPAAERVRTLVRATGPRASAATAREAAAASDIVVFALPWKPVRDLMPVIGDLSGKILVDPMNEFKMVGGYPAPPDLATSICEVLQSWAPKAKVVKAFNTPAAKSIVDPRRAGGHVSIPLAGADVDAKRRVAELVRELGLEPVDTGPPIAARYLEAMMRLSFGYYLYSRGSSFEYHLAPVTG